MPLTKWNTKFSIEFLKQIFFVLSLKLFALIILFSFFTLICPIQIKAKETVIPILTYHNFSSETEESYKINLKKFDEQMNYLATHNYSVISLSRLLAIKDKNELPPKPVIISIDDGYKSTYTLAYPLLKKYNFPATLFLYADFIENNQYSLTWEEIKEMSNHNFEIGSHSLSHPNLLQYKKGEREEDYMARIKKEIFLSKEILENRLGKKVKFFAYPYGAYSSLVKELVLMAGYEGILNANNMNNSFPINPASLNRQIIYGNNHSDSFIEILNQQIISTSMVFPADGEILLNQFAKIGAIIIDSDLDEHSLNMKLGGAKVKFDFSPQTGEIFFTPSRPLIKKSYIVNITAKDKEDQSDKKISWLITIN
ncbi:MAG: hypothetical protein Kow00103_11680 [Candidatus Caldatribacteriota bacterium]